MSQPLKKLNLNLISFTFFPKKAVLGYQQGFTLVELILAISIVVILTTIGIASYTSSAKANAVFNQAQEIQSLARKLQNDAIAAYKPVTGATDATSCKSRHHLVPDTGTMYGTYIIFNFWSTTINYGYACFDSTGTPLFGISGGTGTITLSPRLVMIPDGYRLTIFFSFSGGAYYQHSTSFPTYAYASSPTGLISIPKRVTFSDGTNNSYLYFGGTGLVCVQKTNISPNCAQ